MIGQGVSSRSSHSEAAGRITFSAKPCTHSRMSFWSWFSAIENSRSGASPSVGTCASAARAAASVGVAASIGSAAPSSWGGRIVLTNRSVEDGQAAMQGAYQREGGRAVARIRLHDLCDLEEWPMRDEMSLTEVEPELGAIDAYDA